MQLSQAQISASAEAKSVRPYEAIIASWDLSLVKKWLLKRGYYPETAIDSAEKEYRAFLAKAMANPEEQYVPGQFVDPFWHGHILFTEDYAAMCKRLGYFIHHRPSTIKLVDNECTCCSDAMTN